MKIAKNCSRYGNKHFVKKKQLRDNAWDVKIKAIDQFGAEEEHEWRFKISGYDFVGSQRHKIKKYEKCYCKVKLYDNSDAMLITVIKYTKEPYFNQFNIGSVFEIGFEESSLRRNEYIDFSFTIGTDNEMKPNSFESQFKLMLDEGVFTDMVIETKERQFPCHKVVLATKTEYFKTMFQTDMKENDTNKVDWKDVFEATVVEDLLHFIYTGNIPPNLKDNHFELLKVAHLCLLPNLKVICAKSIGKGIQVDNAAIVLQMADLYESEELKIIAAKFVALKCHQVFETDGFRQMEINLKSRLLEMVVKEANKHLDKKDDSLVV